MERVPMIVTDATRPDASGPGAAAGVLDPAAQSNLIDLLCARAASHAGRPAFRFVRGDGREDGELSYGALHERAVDIAAALQSAMAVGERALMLYPPGLGFVEAFFGCLYAGIVPVPAALPGRRRPASWLGAIAETSGASMILTAGERGDQAEQSGEQLSQMLGRPWMATDAAPSAADTAWRRPDIGAEGTAFLQFTSGSTSSPKGVVLTHANIMANAAMIHRAFGTTPDTRAVFWLPLYHDMGLIGGVIQPVYGGASCTLLAPAAFLHRPALWLETISGSGAMVSGGPDFAFDLCARKVSDAERDALDLSCWRVAFSGAERVRPRTLERFAERFGPCGFRREAFLPCYGLAEATLMVSGGPRAAGPTVAHLAAEGLARHRVQETTGDDPGSISFVGCGECCPEVEVAIVDPESGVRLPESGIGEIWVRGASVARGYFGNPEMTAEVFEARLPGAGEVPFLRTGDLGFLRCGQLFVTGRSKDLIIIRGRNFYAEDIEHAIDGLHVGLRTGHCAAFSVDLGEREHLVIVHEVEPRTRDLDADAAFRAIRRAVVSRHDVEVHAIVLTKAGSIPRTSSGKTRRSACRDVYLGGQLPILAAWQIEPEPSTAESGAPVPVAPTPARSAPEIEAWLTERIGARLGIPAKDIGITTPFFEFGLGSLDAVELAVGLERWLGRRLSPIAIYNHPNIAALARWLAEPVPEPAIPGPSPAPAGAPTVDDIRKLSDEQLAAMVQEEMSRADSN